MRLFRFRYSPPARKVQMLLDLAGFDYELVEVPYSDRSELVALTGGYAYVPVLVDGGGRVVVESRDICERLLEGDAAARLTPRPLEGPIWAYADFADGPLEDTIFRIAAPGVRDSWKSANDRALWVLVRERKFGAGCVDAWERGRADFVSRARRLLAPTLRTLQEVPFLFGPRPTLADAALYGNCVMLEEAGSGLLDQVSPVLSAFARRLEVAARAAKKK